MNRLFRPLSLLLLLSPNLSFALPSDTKAPISITSTEAQFDQNTRSLTYKGKVVAIQGTTKLLADKVIVHFNAENKIDKLEALGHPALYSTLPHPQRERLNASANKIEFSPLQSIVQLIDKAHVSQAGNVMDSPLIEVDIANERIVSKPSEKGRTTIMLQPLQRVKSNDKLSFSQRTDRNKTQTTTR